MAELRRKSITITRQGKELSCAYHVCCKLLLRNMVEWVHPLPIDEALYTTHDCNRFFNTEEMEYHDPRHFTPEMCTENGHIKIHLFRYFYKLYLDATCSRVGAVKPMYLNVSCILEMLYRNDTGTTIVKKIMREVIQLKDSLHITWSSTEVINMPGLFPAIQKIIHLGFYVGACFIDETTCGKHATHAVTIIDTIGENQIVFKDSLGSKDHYIANIDEIFPLESDVCEKTGKPYHYRVEHCIFFLPCRDVPIGFVDTPEKMEEFHAWLDHYTGDFPVLPKPFNVGDKVTTGSITGQIENIVEDGFMVTYKEGTRIKTKRFSVDQLTKVGGSRRRTRKRIR